MNKPDSTSNKRVLVTGAGGFIGSHLTERLVDTGAQVKAFIRYNSRNDWGLLELLPRDKLSEVEIITGDLRDSDAIRHAAEGTDIIFHLGSLIAIPYSYIHPREAIETNIMGTLNVLTAARENNVQRVVHTSTSEVYGTAQYVPINEDHPLHGQSPYSASKIGADMLAESFYRAFNLPVGTIRPFNTFGPRQSARAVIPTIITQALSREQIRLGELHPTRDFTYVDDMVAAFIKVSEMPGFSGETVNIGSNFEISIGDIAGKVMTILGMKKEIVTDSRRVRPEKSEVDRLWCDNTRARKLLGWEPKVSFDEGLKSTIAWISDNIDLYKPEFYNV
ncbi:GDP-mannose 4,6-dehydratase [Chloroflexota bacterium]